MLETETKEVATATKQLPFGPTKQLAAVKPLVATKSLIASATTDLSTEKRFANTRINFDVYCYHLKENMKLVLLQTLFKHFGLRISTNNEGILITEVLNERKADKLCTLLLLKEEYEHNKTFKASNVAKVEF